MEEFSESSEKGVDLESTSQALSPKPDHYLVVGAEGTSQALSPKPDHYLVVGAEVQ